MFTQRSSAKLFIQIGLIYLAIFGVALIPKAINDHRQQVLADGFNQAMIAKQQAPHPKPEDKPEPVITDVPIAAKIERLNLDLKIKAGGYDPQLGGWMLDDKKLLFATETFLPNDNTGVTLIYGRNAADVLQKTTKLKPDDKLAIMTEHGYRFEYVYENEEMIDLKSQEILNRQADKPQLLLVSFGGVLADHGRLMVFDFVKVSKVR